MSSSQIRKSFFQTLLQAGSMTRKGRLLDAMRLLQRALSGAGSGQAQALVALRQPMTPAGVTETATASPAAAPLLAAEKTLPAPPNEAAPVPTALLAAELAAGPAAPLAQPARAEAGPQPATFTEGVFAFAGEPYPYRLYLPTTPGASDAVSAASLPLIVLLHGCTQDAQDFARGTAMNALAEEQHCMVLYPEQIAKANSARCWNWFEPGHQQLGQGEPGMIAALTRQVLAAEHGGRVADPRRVYIAGLSAGGAMAAVVAGLYPDMFAALGVHSGLAAGAAQDLLSAFGAMRLGAKGHGTPALPTIVFHGTADKTVHPDNGDYITGAAVAALEDSGLSLLKNQGRPDADLDQASEREMYSAADGHSYVEHWRVDAGPHAWSGGDAAGSYTDPDGPSASKAMLAFFLQHQKPQPGV